jgi:hypothetical protein
MVAGNGGNGQGKGSGVTIFDFLKAFFMKFDHADLALTEPMPTRETDGDGE